MGSNKVPMLKPMVNYDSIDSIYLLIKRHQKLIDALWFKIRTKYKLEDNALLPGSVENIVMWWEIKSQPQK